MKFLRFALITLTLALVSAYALTTLRTAGEAWPDGVPAEWQVLYISPEGSDFAEGSREAPVATVEKALELATSPKGVAIILAGGPYHQSVEVTGEGAPVLITAARGEHVVFEGGQKVEQWRPHPDYPGVFLTEVRRRESPYGYFEYLDLWDQEERVRYSIAADLPGVAYWAGSVSFVEGETIAFHPHRGETPEGLNLWANRRAFGFSIQRGDVTVRGLKFQNYLGGSDARAIKVGKGQDVTIDQCVFNNCATGVSGITERLTVSNSRFREVGTGVLVMRAAKDLVVRRCVIENAIGRFALSYSSSGTGIRIYHDADGALIEECVVSGYPASLFIKTRTANPEGRPVIFRQNTFLDGIQNGFGYHHRNTTITRNIIGTPKNPVGTGVKAGYFAKYGAKLSGNLFCGPDAPETANPFTDLPGGDLTLHGVPDTEVGAATLRKVSWGKAMAQSLTPKPALRSDPTLIAEPTVTASRAGFVISARYHQPVKATLHYREEGVGEWREVSGGDATIRLPLNMAAKAPFEPWEPESYPWTFSVTDGSLLPERRYEFRLGATDPQGGALPEVTGRFVTSGGAKRLHVRPGGDDAKADGRANQPFGSLQAALDQALPGDVVAVAPGIYSRPVRLLHGGTASAPITIEGAGWERTILDGGKRVAAMMELSGAPYVTVRGMQIRWFGSNGVMVEQSPGFRMEHCRVWNQEFTATGHAGAGLRLHYSPNSVVAYSVFTRMHYGVNALESPQVTLVHNTAFGNLYSGINLENSARGSVVTHNSLTLTGNRPIAIHEKERSAFDTLICDFNNYGSKLRARAGKRPENDFVPAKRYGLLYNESKGITAISMDADIWRDFYTMEDWRVFSGKDRHSIFADPEYADPAKGDFRLLPASPNLRMGTRPVGALPAVGNTSSSPR